MSDSDSDSSSEGGLDALCTSFAPAAEPAPSSKRKRGVEAAIAAAHKSSASLEAAYAAHAPPAPAPAPPPAPAPAPHAVAAELDARAAAIQADLAADFPARHKRPKASQRLKSDARAKHGRSLDPKAAKSGKVRTFNEKEKRSRSARGDNDYVQEEKRRLRHSMTGNYDS